jgi:hypothetical protein
MSGWRLCGRILVAARECHASLVSLQIDEAWQALAYGDIASAGFQCPDAPGFQGLHDLPSSDPLCRMSGATLLFNFAHSQDMPSIHPWGSSSVAPARRWQTLSPLAGYKPRWAK